jgi:hypothetical protein
MNVYVPGVSNVTIVVRSRSASIETSLGRVAW